MQIPLPTLALGVLAFTLAGMLHACAPKDRGESLVVLDRAELFDPRIEKWTPTAPMGQSRQGHTATLLQDGRVLVAGGRSPGGGFADNLTAAEIFDPKTETWRTTGSLHDARSGHTATRLSDGRVLVAGGRYPQDGSAEIYDPKSGTWTPAAKMNTPRDRHAATLLPDGRVIVGGGFCHPRGGAPVADVEIYDPGTGVWTPAAPMADPRSYHTATLVDDGRILMAGGENAKRPMPHDNIASAELYNAAQNRTQLVAEMALPRSYGQSATALPDGLILIAGGEPNEPGGEPLATCERFDPADNTWRNVASLRQGRNFHSASPLPSGSILAAGGYGADGPLASAEIYDPHRARWRTVAAMNDARAWHTGTALADGRILVAGGWSLRSSRAEGARAARTRPKHQQGEILATDQAGPSDIVVDETHLYWTNRESGQLVQLAKGGGTPRVLVDRQKSIGRLCVDKAHVYWTAGADILKLSKAGGEPIVLATAETRGRRGPSGIAVDDASVYWTNYFEPNGNVNRVGKNGGPASLLAAGQDGAFYLAVGASHVYWTNHSGPGQTVMRISRGGGEPAAIATDQYNPTFIAVDENAAYWTNLTKQGTVMKWEKAGGKPRKIADEQAGPCAIALDESRVYWTSLDIGPDRWARQSWILSVPKKGGPSRVIAQAAQHFWGLAVDEEYVYWTSFRSGTISKAPKPLR